MVAWFPEQNLKNRYVYQRRFIGGGIVSARATHLRVGATRRDPRNEGGGRKGHSAAAPKSTSTQGHDVFPTPQRMLILLPGIAVVALDVWVCCADLRIVFRFLIHALHLI